MIFRVVKWPILVARGENSMVIFINVLDMEENHLLSESVRISVTATGKVAPKDSTMCPAVSSRMCDDWRSE